jgi:glycerate-2-kinase
LAALKVVDFILAPKNYTATAIIWGGETTVTKTGTGRGGRNQEFVLAALQKLVGKSFKSFTLASIGTDGIDGPTDAAGAFIDNQVLTKVAAQNLIIKDYLNNNDSYTFFDNIDSLIRTGPSGTNVADIGCCLIAKD